ncbi:MAG: 50S ribosomal protein L10 [Chlamydiales bacterium]|nr:50S ribosomal protein L10 [Chlamydiia bacterium]MCP5506744.1 50S ribosomal protein L10 [Chlamydiales bacterium]
MRPEKQLLLDEVKDEIENFGSFVIMHYQGMTANLASTFRTDIAKMGGSVKVIRKRVLVKAAEAAGISLELSQLPGHIGLVFAGEDAIETTKAVFQYKKDNKGVFEVIGGRFDGQLYSGQQVETLSTLPGKDEMRSQLLSVFEAPMSHTLSTMEAILTSVMHCLENKSKQEADN